MASSLAGKRVYMDVGANDGSSSLPWAADPANVVFAFEPTPRMADIIESRRGGRENYHVIRKAVSDFAGRATFHISGQADWGCSSLAHFNDNLGKTWPGRTDFRVTESIEVEVITLRDFVLERGIEAIEHLHVDAQGHDMEVLLGLGDCLARVRSGVIEMPTSHDRKLYKDQKYLDEDAIRLLEASGFRILSVTPNDRFRNEVNIRFERA